MGTCIICGKPVDDHVCEFHEEDVAFEFEGTSASELVTSRYYRGSVDGYADFGLFVDIGDHVTGLLHRSELDRRLESLDLEPGDPVYVQVLDVRDNGNIDLGWSIRQDDREFRGKVIQTPDGNVLPDERADDGGESTDESNDTRSSGTADVSADVATETTSSADEQSTPASIAASTSTSNDDAGHGSDSTSSSSSSSSSNSDSSSDSTSSSGSSANAATATEDATPSTPLNRATIDTIENQVGSVVRLEGEITGVRQTSGPTVFELSDETGTVECAAFEEAGVRAYPAVEIGDVVTLDGEVERHYGDLQIETETLEVLEDEDRETVTERLEDAIDQQARPTIVAPLVDDPIVETVEDEIVDAATAIRRAVVEARPIVVRHSATADGYVAGAALERAILPLIEEKHTRDDAVYHYVERRPLDGHVYDMDAATGDVTSMLEARDRHGEQLPLMVLVDAGSTTDSLDGYELLDIYGADRLVIDGGRADADVTDSVSVAVSPSLADGDADADADRSAITTTTLAANVAAHVNDDVRADLEHLPAVSFWDDVPKSYADLAENAGYDAEACTERREAVALEAYYQSYKDKRELVADLLFDGAGDGDLAAHVAAQFRAKLETELETARENLEIRDVDGRSVAVIDTAAFIHRFDFPTTTLLLDELHRRSEESVTLGVGEDELYVRSDDDVDVRELGSTLETTAPDAGITVVGGRDGYIEFLSGERETVREAALEALGESLA
ncbi:DHH family phosphoesterase [Natronosalvus halobius]|uniref:DHH family phosphoesterase n=1 Tax=Natronosalvus halobius TaxID=2953746 RepID=UPI0020A19283|nr:OB-fold nucleic acid binding domain-containing protein [Natronosalvus halobius]USZ71822.1 OB-fold nucleic acid binding domain-containing protein [Natronosalvus halobius]